MKKLTLSLCAAFAMTAASFAGETYSKESKSVTPPPCPQWYADSEFNLTLSGSYVWSGSEWREDTYLTADHGWGGSLDAKYFVHRYFGFGIQGNIMRVNTDETIENGFNEVRVGTDHDQWMGSVLGTFTLRFPISCTRWAPYFWVAGGGIFGGGQDHRFELNPVQPLGIQNHEFHSDKTKVMGQVGGGLEVRITPHIGWTNDVSWNVISGSNNNFGMARTGINFAF